MASADVTLPGSSVLEFEVDGTQRTATLNKPGGYLYNSGSVEAVVNVDAGTVDTSQGRDPGNMPVPSGKSAPLPPTCGSFTFKAGSSTYLVYTPN